MMATGPATQSWFRRAGSRSPADRVGGLIREYRLAGKLSQVTVARAMGVTQQFLSQIENGTRRVTLEQRQKFAQILGVPPESLGLSSQLRQLDGLDEEDSAAAVSRGRWRAQRSWLNQHRFELAQLAADWYAVEYRVPRTALIAPPEWIPEAPVNIDQLRMRLDESPHDVLITGHEPESLAVRPLHTADVHFGSYTSAIKHLDPPQLFDSRPSYRYLGGSLTSREMAFGLATYFDKLDLSEALAHELVVACSDRLPTSVDELYGRLPLRELVDYPFDASRRAIVPAITTLTIRLRRYPAAPSFLLHWRDPTKVATAAGIYDVIPAGEFQPSSVALWDRTSDFSIWRNIVREYSEELLGIPEHDGTSTEPIDYANWPLYQTLTQAKQDGTVTASVLGMGLDALTLAATILTVVVIDDDVFNDVFGTAVRFNDEGEIVAVGDGAAADGVPFTEEAVTRVLESEPMASPGAACLALAWKHRRQIIG